MTNQSTNKSRIRRSKLWTPKTAMCPRVVEVFFLVSKGLHTTKTLTLPYLKPRFLVFDFFVSKYPIISLYWTGFLWFPMVFHGFLMVFLPSRCFLFGSALRVAPNPRSWLLSIIKSSAPVGFDQLGGFNQQFFWTCHFKYIYIYISIYILYLL